jgi:hypothetical protein
MYDRQTKVADYRHSASIFAEVLRREGDRWITEIVRGPEAMLSLASIGLTATMSDLYEGIDLLDPAAAAPGSDRS